MTYFSVIAACYILIGFALMYVLNVGIKGEVKFGLNGFDAMEWFMHIWMISGMIIAWPLMVLELYKRRGRK